MYKRQAGIRAGTWVAGARVLDVYKRQTQGERRALCEQRKRLLLDAAEALDAHHIKVGDFLNTPCPMPQLIDSFAALCEQAAARGTDVLFELMPFAQIHTLPGALELVTGAGAVNGRCV